LTVGPSERSSRSSSWTADGDLVAGVRRGDEESFERLVGRYRAPVIAYVRARVADRDLSEDIAQEIFISALRSMRASERPIVFKAWIYEIARNACIDQHRRRGRRAETAGLHDGLVDLSPAKDPPAALELSQRLAALCLAFGQLPPVERELLAGRELGGRPYAELASSTGLSVPAVESAVHRGRRRLRVNYRLLTGDRPAPPPAAVAPGPVGLWDTGVVHRGVAQPGSAHRSGR
jgi:RNA polymerase sigma-70 factor (ECF subfamily)